MPPNYDTISDVLLHISYTACEGGQQAAKDLLPGVVTAYAAGDGFYCLVSLRSEFPEAMFKLFTQPGQETSFDFTAAHFPFLFGKTSANGRVAREMIRVVFEAYVKAQSEDVMPGKPVHLTKGLESSNRTIGLGNQAGIAS